MLRGCLRSRVIRHVPEIAIRSTTAARTVDHVCADARPSRRHARTSARSCPLIGSPMRVDRASATRTNASMSRARMATSPRSSSSAHVVGSMARNKATPMPRWPPARDRRSAREVSSDLMTPLGERIHDCAFEDNRKLRAWNAASSSAPKSAMNPPIRRMQRGNPRARARSPERAPVLRPVETLFLE
jgi:hypothetical protein